MDNWDEIRTAFQVARLGTVSGAAEALGVHHATVIRHIDSLERRLGAKLFQRHPRGYTPTEEGQDLFRVAQTTDDQFQQLAGRIKGRGEEITGELLVTSLTQFYPLLLPALIDFQKEHPDLTVRFLTDARVYRLEYGEAHVALRAGAAPQESDNVVQKFQPQSIGLYASQSYVARYGLPASEDDLKDHRFVGFDNEDLRAPFQIWFKERVPFDRVMFRSRDTTVLFEAVRGGAGIGFLLESEALKAPDLVEVMPPNPAWTVPLWIVTHVDLHRTPKVQAFLKFFKTQTAQDPDDP